MCQCQSVASEHSTILSSRKESSGALSVEKSGHGGYQTLHCVDAVLESSALLLVQLQLDDPLDAIRAQDIWTRTFAEVGEEYPDIEQDHAYVDAACMWMIKNPESFDTVVTTNLFGDIITDLGAVLQGGMGVAASGNINPGQVSMFESIHGSAPKYKGKNVSCPIAAISAVQMMLDHLGEGAASARIEGAIEAVLRQDDVTSVSASSGISTDEWGDRVLEMIRSL